MIKLNGANRSESLLGLDLGGSLLTNKYAGFYKLGGEFNKNLFLSTEKKVKTNDIEDMSRAFAMASFAIENKVGITTVSINLIESMANMSKQFLNKNGRVSIPKVKKVFKTFAKNRVIKGKRYGASIFQPLYNMVYTTDRYDRVLKMYHVSIKEIKEFVDRIETIDPELLTIEDIKQIALDFDPIGRAMQELSIDATKDKDKDLGFNIDDIVNPGTKTLGQLIKKGDKKRPEGQKAIVNNVFDVLSALAKGEKTVPKYFMELNTRRKPLAEANEDNQEELNNAYVVDFAGVNSLAIRDGYNEQMNTVFKYLESCDYKKYSAIKDNWINRANDEKAVYSVFSAVFYGLKHIDFLYDCKKAGEKINGAAVKEKAAKIRNILYSYGAKYGFTPQQVLGIAISCVFVWKVENGKVYESNEKLFSFRSLYTVFGREFIFNYLGSEFKNFVLNLKYTNRDLRDGDEIEFVNGVSLEGDIQVKEHFSGKAKVTTDREIVPIIDVFAYEEVDGEILLVSNLFEPNKICGSIPKINRLKNTYSNDEGKEETISSVLEINSYVNNAKKTKIMESNNMLILVSLLDIPTPKPTVSFIGNITAATVQLFKYDEKGEKVGTVDMVIDQQESIISPNGGFVIFK